MERKIKEFIMQFTKYILILLTGLGLLVTAGCDSDWLTSSANDESSVKLQIKIDETQHQIIKSDALIKPFTITEVRVTVTGPDMDPVEKTLSKVDEDTYSGTVSVKKGDNRKFSVDAYDGNNILQYSGTNTMNISRSSESITIDLNPLRPDPVTLSIAATSASSVDLSWSQSTIKDFQYYAILRSQSTDPDIYNSDDWIAIAESRTTLSYTDDDENLVTGETYYYQVHVVDTENWPCTGSNIEDATLNISAPQGVTVSANNENYISVSWNAVAGASSYRVYRSESETGSYDHVHTTTATGWNDDTVLMAKFYYYKISAYVSGKYSALSDPVSGYRIGFRFDEVRGYDSDDGIGFTFDLRGYGYNGQTKLLLIYACKEIDGNFYWISGTGYNDYVAEAFDITPSYDASLWDDAQVSLPDSYWPTEEQNNDPPKYYKMRIFKSSDIQSDFNDPYFDQTDYFSLTWSQSLEKQIISANSRNYVEYDLIIDRTHPEKTEIRKSDAVISISKKEKFNWPESQMSK